MSDNNEALAQVIHVVLDDLGIDYEDVGYRLALACPVHGSDNPESCQVYYNSNVPNWKCYTHNCHSKHGTSLPGLIQGIKGKREGLELLKNYFTLSKFERRNPVLDDIRVLEQKRILSEYKLPKEQVNKRLNIPSSYFLERGFSADILKQFHVGDAETGYMAGRAIVPIFDDDDENMVGCLGRTLYKKCCLCNKYHNFNHPCPSNKKLLANASKWKNSKGLRTDSYLYGLWVAKPHIIATNTIILVEGQGDVWRMHEAGYPNTVGVFGCVLSDNQKLVLESLPIYNMFVIGDPDEAGQEFVENVKKDLSRFYNIESIEFEKDPGESEISYIRKKLEEVEEEKAVW